MCMPSNERVLLRTKLAVCRPAYSASADRPRETAVHGSRDIFFPVNSMYNSSVPLATRSGTVQSITGNLQRKDVVFLKFHYHANMHL